MSSPKWWSFCLGINASTGHEWLYRYHAHSIISAILLFPVFSSLPLSPSAVNPLRPRQNRRHFADDIFKSIFLNENVWIPIKISMKFVSKGPINKIPALVQIMAWRRPGDKPLSEPMMVSLTTHICVTRPQWVKVIPKDMGEMDICLNKTKHSKAKTCFLGCFINDLVE